MLPTAEQLQGMRQADIMELERAQLADIADIVIDPDLSGQERVRSFIEQTGNPFAWKDGDYVVQIGFSEETEDSIEERLLLLMEKKLRPTF